MRTSKKDAASAPDVAAEDQLRGFIDKFEAGNAGLIRSARQQLRKMLPGANELVYENYKFFVIGYSPTVRPSDTIVSIAAAANGVGLSFYHGATLPDPHKVLLGSGKQNRFVRIESTATLSRPDVTELIDAAVTQSKTPLRAHAKGELIIRSIAEKQRARRTPHPDKIR